MCLGSLDRVRGTMGLDIKINCTCMKFSKNEEEIKQQMFIAQKVLVLGPRIAPINFPLSVELGQTLLRFL